MRTTRRRSPQRAARAATVLWAALLVTALVSTWAGIHVRVWILSAWVEPGRLGAGRVEPRWASPWIECQGTWAAGRPWRWWFAYGPDASGAHVIVPFWAILAAAAAPVLLLWRTAWRARSGCPACGYSLSGLAPGAACPECGHSAT